MKSKSKNVDFASSDSDIELIDEMRNGEDISKEIVEEKDFSKHLMSLPNGD